MKPYLRIFIATPLLAAALSLSGCLKSYNEPVFVSIDPNETAYVIPLTGNTDDQAKFNSVDFLEQHKVGAKRIQVPRVWVDNGYMYGSGYYQDAVRVIKVDRTPVTIQFEQNDQSLDQNGHMHREDNAIWLESRDSIGFSMGFSATLRIEENDTSTYLYRYPGVSLAQEAKSEVKARIQSDASAFAAQYNLDTLRSLKNELMQAVRSDVVPYFASRGITITTVAQFGGMVYDDKDIQSAINGTFVAQQSKVVAAALLTAQKDINTKSDETAHQDQLNAITRANGEAQAIKLVADASREAASNPVFLKLRELEIDGKRIEKWNGVTPSTLIEGAGQGSGMNLFIQPKE